MESNTQFTAPILDDSWIRVEGIIRIQDQWIDLIKKVRDEVNR